VNRGFDVTEPRKQRFRAILSGGTQSRTVDERVNGRQRPVCVRFGCDTTARLRMMHVAAILASDLELRRADSPALNAFGPDRLAIDRQAAEGGADLLERHARIDERADDHVARGAREAVEVQDFHNLSILPDATGQTAGLDQRVIPLLAQNQVIDDLDSHDVAGADHPRRQREVVVAWRRVTRRMVVKQDDGRG
jgi:hypothetical protein